MPQREAAVGVLPANAGTWQIADRAGFIEDVRQALYSSKVVAYSQGFDQIAAASAEFDWNIDRGAMARIWRGGCIIRARFLNRITEAYERQPDLPLLLADPYFTEAVGTGVASWRRIVAQAALNGVPTPAFASSLSYYDGLRARAHLRRDHPGPARPVRCPHLQAGGQARHVPHPVDRRPHRDRGLTCPAPSPSRAR